jgi:molybdopterin-synthase adenylyltransferase
VLVTVVGCGAVGSHTAVGLVAAGVGKLRLIDPETLEPGNIHRHALGMRHVGRPKVEGLAEVIRERFPHVSVEPVCADVRSLLSGLDDADLSIFALGEETIERTVCRVLPTAMRRLHAWVEPLGLGGHVLALGLGGVRACYCCLFRDDSDHGLINMSAFTAPGQNLLRTIEGCSGTFTPFGYVDAQHAAGETVRMALDVLAGELDSPTLCSWQTSRRNFERAGGRLSRRGDGVQPGSSIRITDFARPECLCCREGKD